MKKLIFIPLFLSICFIALEAQEMNSMELLEESYDYHDFNRLMFTKGYVFRIEETRPGAESRFCTLRFDPSNEYYHIRSKRDGNILEYLITGDSISFKLNGGSKISHQDAEKFKLNKDRAILLKNYYYYLWYLPLKLNDKGTHIHPQAKITELKGAKYWDIKVSYPDQTDSDEWHIYLDPVSYKMEAYQFFKTDGKKGEYILLEDEVNFDGLRIPASRSWYVNETDSFLGADILLSIEHMK